MQIEHLTKEYPPAARGLGALALREYPRIAAARAHGWQWVEIATSLGVADGRALAAAFRRVKRKVADGRLTPPTPRTADPASAGGRPLPPVPGTAQGKLTLPAREGFKRIKLD